MSFTQIREFYFGLVPELTDEIWAEVESSAIIRHYRRNQHYITPGEREQYVTFVNKGGFRYYAMLDEKELVCEFIFENNYVSEYESFLRQTPAKIFIQALEDSEVVMLHYDQVQRLYEKYPPLQKFGRIIAENFLLEAIDRSNSLLSSTPEERYNQLTEKDPQLLQRVPQYMIASYIGVTPEALSRIRKRMVYSLT